MEQSHISLTASKKLLQHTKLGDCLALLNHLSLNIVAPPKPQGTIKLSTSSTVGEALRVLATYNILSAPVSDAHTREYVGIMDVMDILSGLLKHTFPELLQEGYVQKHKRLSMMELQAIGIDFGSKSVALFVHGGDLVYKGDRDCNLYEIVVSGFRVGLPPKLHSPHHHLRVHHRCAVFDILPGEDTPDGPIPEWRITDIISQTDVLRLLVSKMDSLAAEDAGMNASLSALGLVQGKVATVTADTPTVIVLDKIHKERLSGIGIVGSASENAPLLANLSVSDLRGLLPERFGALALPVGAFLLLMHPDAAMSGTSGTTGSETVRVVYEDALLDQFPAAVKEGRWEEALQRLPLVACSPETSLREVLEVLVGQGKHRVYCVDEKGCAVGVITPTDVLRAVAMASTY